MAHPFSKIRLWPTFRTFLKPSSGSRRQVRETDSCPFHDTVGIARGGHSSSVAVVQVVQSLGGLPSDQPLQLAAPGAGIGRKVAATERAFLRDGCRQHLWGKR